ncbi:MAG: response regulator transcription factor [Flavobacteriales bacterium]|nr:response regulator transcription factor [Flavobacteriales bacterium]
MNPEQTHMQQNTHPIHIAFVDDHAAVAEGLEAMGVKADFIVDFIAFSGMEMMKLMEENTTTKVVFMDIDMPKMNGIEATRQLKQLKPDVQVIALTAMCSDENMMEMMLAGASAFLFKGIHFSEIADAVRGVLKDGFWSNSYYQNTVRGIQEYLLKKKSLTERQKQYLEYLGVGLSDKMIADKMGITPNTVNNYRTDLFGILGVKSRVELVMEALRKHFIRL